MSDTANQKCFIIEGNIGAGKSTFLRIIQQYLQAQIVYEPLDKWQNVRGYNLFEQFYTDTARWSYTFQSYAFITRILAQKEHAARNPFALQILERSVYSDRYCFAKNLFEMGMMTPLEWQLYQEWFEWLVQDRSTKPDGFIYLRTDPEICYQRLIKRSRAEEQAVSFEYLQRLHTKHEDWLIHKKDVVALIREVPVLVIDCNDDFENSRTVQEQHMEQIICFLEKHYNIPAHVSKLMSVQL